MFVEGHTMEWNVNLPYSIAIVEFALQSHHETFPVFKIPSRSNFNDWEK